MSPPDRTPTPSPPAAAALAPEPTPRGDEVGGAHAVLYFAYGSNLDEAQMLARCPGAIVLGRAVLLAHRLVFDGFSRARGGAVAAVRPSADEVVEGIVYALPPLDLVRLDTFEGCPRSYARVERAVTLEQGHTLSAQIYVRPPGPYPLASPARAYLEQIRDAYHRLDLDTHRLDRSVERARRAARRRARRSADRAALTAARPIALSPSTSDGNVRRGPG